MTCSAGGRTRLVIEGGRVGDGEARHKTRTVRLHLCEQTVCDLLRSPSFDTCVADFVEWRCPHQHDGRPEGRESAGHDALRLDPRQLHARQLAVRPGKKHSIVAEEAAWKVEYGRLGGRDQPFLANRSC